VPTKTIYHPRMVLVLSACIALSGCSLSLFGHSETEEASETSPAIETARAILTETASASSTDVLSSTPTAIQIAMQTTVTATETTTPTATPTYPAQVETLCDVAGFISDVTIPDGTEIEAGTTFTKTWELRNDGTCTWTSGYDLVFYSGDQMDGEEAITIGDVSVAPGETLEISIELTAPEEPGQYIGYWMLQNESGSLFGIGSGYYAFYVDITVVEAQATSTPTQTTTPLTPTSTLEEAATLTPTTTASPTETTSVETPSPTTSSSE